MPSTIARCCTPAELSERCAIGKPDLRAIAADNRNRRRAYAGDQIEASPPTRHQYTLRPRIASARAGETVPIRRCLGDKRQGHRSKVRRFLREARPDRLAGEITARLETGVHPREERLIHRGESRRTRNGHQGLAPQRFAAGLHSAFVMAFAWPTEARLHEIMRREGRKPRRQDPLPADEDADHGRGETVVRNPASTTREMRAKARTRPSWSARSWHTWTTWMTSSPP